MRKLSFLRGLQNCAVHFWYVPPGVTEGTWCSCGHGINSSLHVSHVDGDDEPLGQSGINGFNGIKSILQLPHDSANIKKTEVKNALTLYS